MGRHKSAKHLRCSGLLQICNKVSTLLWFLQSRENHLCSRNVLHKKFLQGSTAQIGKINKHFIRHMFLYIYGHSSTISQKLKAPVVYTQAFFDYISEDVHNNYFLTYARGLYNLQMKHENSIQTTTIEINGQNTTNNSSMIGIMPCCCSCFCILDTLIKKEELKYISTGALRIR